jgi:hypothetical protein
MSWTKVAVILSFGCLVASPALAQEDLIAKARQQFEPIPAIPPELPGSRNRGLDFLARDGPAWHGCHVRFLTGVRRPEYPELAQLGRHGEGV